MAGAYPRAVFRRSSSVSDFVAYGSSPGLSPDEVYTIELLVDLVRSEVEPDFRRGVSARDRARGDPAYAPSFDMRHLRQTGEALRSRAAVDLGAWFEKRRPARDIRALAFFPGITFLFLKGQEVSDLEPLRSLPDLETLNLAGNPARDLSPLSGCVRLTDLTLPDGPFPDLAPLAGCARLEKLRSPGLIEDLSVLEALPTLRGLSLVAGNVPAFRRLTRLPRVTRLRFLGDTLVDSFLGFPEMPELRYLEGPRVESLEGIQRFTNLRNMEWASGTFDSLTPLHALPYLTHLTIRESGLRSLETASGLLPLRRFEMRADRGDFDLEPLKALPALHEATIWAGSDGYTFHPGQEALRAELSPWDTEFRAPRARYTPSLKIEVVNRKAEDCQSPDEGVGLTEADDNEGMLVSEFHWLRSELDRALESYGAGEPGLVFATGTGWRECRCMPATMGGEEPPERLPALVMALQEALCHCANDWIIHLAAHTDEERGRFVAWIHPNKVAVPAEHAKRVRRLLRAP